MQSSRWCLPQGRSLGCPCCIIQATCCAAGKYSPLAGPPSMQQQHAPLRAGRTGDLKLLVRGVRPLIEGVAQLNSHNCCHTHGCGTPGRVHAAAHAGLAWTRFSFLATPHCVSCVGCHACLLAHTDKRRGPLWQPPHSTPAPHPHNKTIMPTSTPITAPPHCCDLAAANPEQASVSVSDARSGAAVRTHPRM
jgi:hypothetical protein